MTTRLALTHTQPPRPRTTEDRQLTVQLDIFEAGPETFRVMAGGSLFATDGGRYTGTLTVERNNLYGAVHQLRTAWSDGFLRHTAASVNGYRPERPFASNLDLRADAWREGLDSALERMATAGRRLFRLLFDRYADEHLREIGEMLRVALPRGRQFISVSSRHLDYIPWPLLYTDADPAAPAPPGDPRFFQGFWGYSHVIERQLPRMLGTEHRTRIEVADRVQTGFYVDRDLDREFHPLRPVAAVEEYLDGNAGVELRRGSQSAELERDLTDDKIEKHLVYLGCHGSVTGAGTALEIPQLVLTDKNQPITAADVDYWFPADRKMQRGPIMFINACEGGQTSSLFYTSFSKALLDGGANCVLGPEIEIPPLFARDYAVHLLRGLLDNRRIYLGDLVQSAAQHFADAYRNPLGLVYTLTRGLNTHLWRPGDAVDAPPPPAVKAAT